MESVDWDMTIKVALAVIAIAGFYISWRGGRRKEKREIAAEQRAEEASRRTAAAKLWRPTEAEIERIVRETQEYQQRHPLRFAMDKDHSRELVLATLPLVSDYIGRYVNRLRAHPHDETMLEISADDQAELRRDFPRVIEQLVRCHVALVKRGNVLRHAMKVETDDASLVELRPHLELNRALTETLDAYEWLLFESVGIPFNERQAERNRVERALRG